MLMALRTHRYATRLLEDWSRGHPDVRKLPLALVLVLYHGDEEWTVPVELEELLAVGGAAPAARGALRPYLPKQRYLLEVLPLDPKKVRSGRGAARITMLALNFGRSTEPWTAIIASEDDLHELLSDPRVLLPMAELLIDALCAS
jgi:hypothetical protein